MKKSVSKLLELNDDFVCKKNRKENALLFIIEEN